MLLFLSAPRRTGHRVPEDADGADCMSGAPGPVSEAQMKELHVKSTWEGQG
ncbi:MAG TPA: hypothetical protein VFF69_12335 [Phycisphaerales bacterium]|nr:hypothetical protein [Phycisphaerales bacterium]